MARFETPAADRVRGAVGALILQALLGLALFLGLRGPPPAVLAERALIYVEPPPRRIAVPVRKPARTPRPRARAAPPAARAVATPVVAPPPIIAVPTPPIILAAPLPAAGADPSLGAAQPGQGRGAGGIGAGTGSGDAGDGDGGGGTPSRWVKGRIRDSDYPRAAAAAMIEGSLVTRYEIDASGRVAACAVVTSSGNPILDETTCRLVRQRYRYAPARDAAGRAVADVVIQNHSWVIVPPGS